jgi:hypothetical protein
LVFVTIENNSIRYITLSLLVDYLLEICCEINNSKKHRTIKAVPENVFNLLELNKQNIIRLPHDRYDVGTIVIKKSESKGAFSNKIFNFDPELYVIGQTEGRKYRLINLGDLVDGKQILSTKRYQPYEIRPFLSRDELLAYLTSDLIKNTLIKLYGEFKYNRMVDWAKQYK